MKSKNHSIKQRLIELVDRYEELVQYGPYGRNGFLCDMDQIDSILPENITCGRDVEVALEKAWFSFTGEYELIQEIVSRVKVMMKGIHPKPIMCDGQYSFVFNNNEIRYPEVA